MENKQFSLLLNAWGMSAEAVDHAQSLSEQPAEHHALKHGCPKLLYPISEH